MDEKDVQMILKALASERRMLARAAAAARVRGQDQVAESYLGLVQGCYDVEFRFTKFCELSKGGKDASVKAK